MNEGHINVEIITIGDEILIGQIVDTNSAWMATELNSAGFELKQITSVHDDEQQIIEALDAAQQRADIVLLTGGIGPTKDDITKQTLCKYFDTKLVFDTTVFENIERLFAVRKLTMNELTKNQALVPESAIIIQNKMGTAPITWFEKAGKVIVSMPGVPYEMKDAMQQSIIPRLKEHFKAPVIVHKTVLVSGYPESVLALKIAEWENALPNNFHLAYLPNFGLIRLRVSAIADDPLELTFSINQQIDLLHEILGNAIVATEDLPIEKVIANELVAQSKTIAVAESCTGGNIAHRITLLSGSSEYFKGGVIAYSNDIKANLLRVKKEDIIVNGAVSQTVVEQMAKGARALLNADVSVATSGIAGPTGGSNEKPVGIVWIAASSEEQTISKEFHFGLLREQNIERATQSAFVLVKELLNKTKKGD